MLIFLVKIDKMNSLKAILSLKLSPINHWSSRRKESVLEEEIKKQDIRNILSLISGNDIGKYN